MLKRYRVPVHAISFADQKVSDRIQLFRTGKFFNHQAGDFEITKDVLAKMLANFEANALGVDIAVDYGHDAWDECAGWIKKLYIEDEGDELWAEVAWTPEAEQKLQEKRWRYMSPEFALDYQHNESLKWLGPTLLGAGLTNRPFIKNMAPVVELSEKIHADEAVKPEPSGDLKGKQLKKGEKGMDYKAMDPAELDKMSPEELKAMVIELLGKLEDMGKAMGDAQGKVAVMEADKALSEKKATFARMLSEGKAVQAQEESFLAGDLVKFAELSAPVKFSEIGSGKGAPEIEAPAKDIVDAQDKVMKLAEVKVKAGMSLSDAYKAVLSENVELRKKIYG